MAAMDRLTPSIRVGERVSLRLTDPARDLVGFVVAVDPLTLEDRHGRVHVVASGTVAAARRVGPDPGPTSEASVVMSVRSTAGSA